MIDIWSRATSDCYEAILPLNRYQPPVGRPAYAVLATAAKAAEERVVFYPAEAGVVSKDKIAQIEIERSHFDAAAQAVFYQPGHGTSPKDLVLVCEGQSDREALAILVQRILAAENKPKKVEIIAALGKIAVPRVLNSIMGDSS